MERIRQHRMGNPDSGSQHHPRHTIPFKQSGFGTTFLTSRQNGSRPRKNSRERVHPAIQPPKHDRESVERQDDLRRHVRPLRDFLPRGVEEGPEVQGDAHAVGRVRGGEAVLEMV